MGERGGIGRIRLGVDIGGTFTDLVLWGPGGRQYAGKVLTTPQEPQRAVLEGTRSLLAQAGVRLSDVSQIVHGTTLVTNAVIERKGARTALITTAGCRDVVEIGREIRFDIYDLFIDMPQPMAPRDLRYEVDERVTDSGAVLRPLDIAEVERLAHRLRADGVQAAAICLLFSWLNPAHELAIRDALARLAPEISVTASCELSPEIGEYERSTTALLNAYVQPLVDRYIARLEGALREAGFRGQLLLMLSNGGTATIETTRRYPIRLLESGPAAGALAAARLGDRLGLSNLLSFDMGGTTAKACFIVGGQPVIAHEFEAARAYRFKQGSGLPVRTPVIELIEIGAGGGSIARIDELGLLKVGPDSAGADPGPACYGRGGTQPTVTDADLVLGLLDPEYFLGGSMSLDVQAARAAIRPLADALGLNVEQAAWGIHSVVNENMAVAARIHAAERGVDVRDFVLTAFGGAGPVHAWRVAAALGITRILLPHGAGVASALGLLSAPLAFDFIQAVHMPLEAADWLRIAAGFEDMQRRAAEVLGAAGAQADEIAHTLLADMRYQGQGNEISVTLPARRGDWSADAVMALFESEYVRLFGQAIPKVGAEIINLRLVATGRAPEQADRQAGSHREEPAAARRPGHRPVYAPELGQSRDCAVHDRRALDVGRQLSGPAVIEERESTAILGAGSRIRVLPGGHLLAELG